MQTTGRKVSTALVSGIGLLLIVGASLGGSRVERTAEPFGSRDVLSTSVSPGELSAYLAAEDARAGFRIMTQATLFEGTVRVHAAMAYANDFQLKDSATAAAGIVLYRIDADDDYEPLGLTRGSNYLWMDAKGPAENPWRGIMISSDGTHRSLMTAFKYTPATEHNNFSPLDHQQQYCNGLPGCIYARSTSGGDGTVWIRCTNGCCELQQGVPPQGPRPPRP